jgi:hypothetical protein
LRHSIGNGDARTRALIGDEIAARCTRDSLQFDPRHGAGEDVLKALLRQVDRIDPSYRE